MTLQAATTAAVTALRALAEAAEAEARKAPPGYSRARVVAAIARTAAGQLGVKEGQA